MPETEVEIDHQITGDKHDRKSYTTPITVRIFWNRKLTCEWRSPETATV